MKGWKNLNKELICRSFQFEIGKWYKHNGEIRMCGAGFHFHQNPLDIYKYYKRNNDTIVVEIEYRGEFEHGNDKSVCSEIKIIKILTEDETKQLCNLITNTGLHNTGNDNSGNNNSGNDNSGNDNSGNNNSGNRNSGYRNSGNNNSGNRNSGNNNSGYRNSGNNNSGNRNSRNNNSGNRNSGDDNSGYRNSGDNNSGNRNSGDDNSGDDNSGYRNSGDDNSGNRNSGDRNSGYDNSGNRNSGNDNSGYDNSGDRNSGNDNSGDYNKCNHSTGYFNIKTEENILTFNKPCKRTDWERAAKPSFFYFELTEWVYESAMTSQEKKEHPEFFCQQGYLKIIGYKEAWAKSFESASKEDIELLKALPNFDAEIFYEISGVRV